MASGTSARKSFIDSGGDGDDDDADECDYHDGNDDLHLAVATPHLPLHCRRTSLENLRILCISNQLPFMSSAFLCSPSRLTWLSSNFRVLSEMSSFICIQPALRRRAVCWPRRSCPTASGCCTSRLSTPVCLWSAASGCSTWGHGYVGLARVVSDLREVGAELIDRRVDVSFRVVAHTQCEEEEVFVVSLAEPHPEI